MEYEDEGYFGEFIKDVQNMEAGLYFGSNLLDKMDWSSKARNEMKKRNQVVTLMKQQIKNAKTLNKSFQEQLNHFLIQHLEKVNQLKPSKRKSSGKEKRSKKQRELTEIVIEEVQNPLQAKDYQEPAEPQEVQPSEEQMEEPPSTPIESPPEEQQEQPPQEGWQP